MELKKKNWNDALFYATIIHLVCFFMSKMITSSWHPDSYSTLEKLTNFAHWVIPSFGAALASFFLIKNGDADSVKRIASYNTLAKSQNE